MYTPRFGIKIPSNNLFLSPKILLSVLKELRKTLKTISQKLGPFLVKKVVLEEISTNQRS